MSNKHVHLAMVLMPAFAFAQTQQKLVPRFDLPANSPVSMVSHDWGDSTEAPRGGASFVDLRGSLVFRNETRQRIHGVTVSVLSQEMTPGGKGSVSVPSLDVGPNETFPVNINLHLLRPIGASGPPVQVQLDGVLFDDLSFIGPDKLNSRRTMTVWEMEARRDRQYFKKLLETAGSKGLQDGVISSLARQAQTSPSPGVQVLRGRATNSDPESEVSFAFLHFPGAPIEGLSGMARIAGNEAHAPHVDVKNSSERAIRFLEIGWIVRDEKGREFLAASMPADVNLAPGKSGQVGEDAALKFLQRTTIKGMTGFVSSVGFEDGTYWIPDRNALNKLAVGPSPEEQRLVQLYLKRGINGLIDELKKF
jgi:hypothetical protein